MITLNASGGSITFTFSGNSTYLNDGVITCPVNSLALIIDESDMVTFRKSASADIFVSANIAEFGMTKAELESWFKENAVGSTGGGVTPEEVEEMIDEAISGITVSGVTEEELNEAIASAKTEIEAEIPTVPTSNTAFTNDAGYATSGYVDSSVSGYADSCLYDDNTKAVKFYHGGTGGTEVYSFDASPFLVDGMIDDVRIETISGVTYLVIDFNTASGKEDIQIALTDIFDASNYYDKTEIDAIVSGKTNESDFSAHTANTIIHVTSSQTAYWDAKSDFSGSYNDLTDKPTIPTVPTSNTAFTNDAGYITEDALSGYAESSAVTEVSDALTAHTANTTVHITSAERTAWNAKSDFSGSYNDLTDKPTIPTVPTSNTAFTNDAGYITSGEAQSQIDNSISGKADTATTYSKTETDNAITAATATKQDTLVSGTNIRTINNISILGSGNIDIQGGGGSGVSVVEVTQAEYDELPSSAKTDTSKMYVITDAQAVDISQYWTSAQTQSAITQATSGKVDSSSVVTAVTSASTDNEIPTAKAVFDAIPTGGTGGGKAVAAGTNISVTTGETADTINCTLPIIKGVNLGATSREHSVMIGYDDQRYVGNYIKKDYSASIGFANTIDADRSVCLGSDNYAKGFCSIAMNQVNSAMTNYSVASGYRSKTSNEYEFASGVYNNSVTGSSTFGDSGNTLFSVGNGTADDARHNAFEIRQNGDIYFFDGTNDVKLQDVISNILNRLTTIENNS